MTQVNITETKNTVTVNEGDATVVTVATQGPQGATTDFDLDSSAKVNGSVVYYDSSAGKFKADDDVTRLKLVFGGSF